MRRLCCCRSRCQKRSSATVLMHGSSTKRTVVLAGLCSARGRSRCAGKDLSACAAEVKLGLCALLRLPNSLFTGNSACQHLTQSMGCPERLHSVSVSDDRPRAELTTLLAF